MTQRVLVCLDGYRVEAALDVARAALAADAAWLLLHVVDTRPLEEAGRALGGLVGRGPGRDRAARRLRQTVDWTEEDVRLAVGGWLGRTGRVAELMLTRGRPEREIIRVAEERGVEVVVVGGGRGLPGRYPGPGPYPLSPVARFVVDHARCDVLLLRRYIVADDRRA